MPAPINFSKFSKRLSDLSGPDAKKVNETLNERLKAYLISKVAADKKKHFEKKLKPIIIDLSRLREKSISEVVSELKTKYFAKDAEVKEMLSELTDHSHGNGMNINSIVNSDRPIRENPALRNEYLEAKSKTFGELAGLPTAAINKLTAEGNDIDEIDDLLLKKMVDDGIIKSEHKKNLELVINLSRLSDENFEFIKALFNSDVSIKDFIDYDREDWKKLITGKNIPLPVDEKSVDDYAKKLERNMETSFPQDFFLNRVIYNKDFSKSIQRIESIDRVKRLGDIKFERSKIVLNGINWAGINNEERKLLEEDIKIVQDLSNQYRYLDITDVLLRTDISTDIRKEKINERLDQLNTFYKNNTAIDFSKHDFFNKESKLDYTGISETNKPLVKAQAMANQRMLALAENTSTATTLLTNGFSSSFDIINNGEREFVNTSGLELNESKKIFTSALNSVAATSHFYQAVMDSQRGGFSSLAVNNMGRIVNDIREIEGYSEIFGNQNFCDCEHCRSIFSPAAYFADLMLFVKKNVTARHFNPPNDEHSLNLKNRRPDLWKLPLTCQNTKEEIPYLDVVNEVMEQYIQSDLVNTSVYEELDRPDISCMFPFNLPLEELRLFLGHFNLTLYDLYKILHVDNNRQLQEKLLLSKKELENIVTPDTVNALKRFGDPSNLDDLQITDFIRYAGITRNELDGLLAIQSFTEISGVKIEITELPDYIQLYVEKFKQGTLTAVRLDIIQRFLKLWKKTPWTIREFDMILLFLKSKNLLSSLEDKDAAGNPKILILADLVTIQNSLKLNVEELCALIDEIPDKPLKADQKGLYERLFNLKEIFGIDPVTETYNTETNWPNDKIISHILSGLSISENEFFNLLHVLGLENTNKISKNILSKLYLHARIASGLKLSIDNLLSAVKICLNDNAISSVSQIVELIKSKAWLETTPFSFLDLDFILDGTENTANRFEFTNERIQTVAAAIKDLSDGDEEKAVEIFKGKLQAELNLTEKQLSDHCQLITIEINSTEIKYALTQNVNDEFVSFFHQFERKRFCFDKSRWKEADINILCSTPGTFGVTNLKQWTLENLKTVALYSQLIKGLDEQGKTNFANLLSSNSIVTFTETQKNVLAGQWSCAAALIQSAIDSISFAGNIIESVNELLSIVKLCSTLGVQADSLIKFKGEDFEGLSEARNVAHGAFASRYPDEKSRNEKLEPYHDKINTLKRDALCNYIIAQKKQNGFKDRSDIYAFFLLDPEMSGCFRTSRILAAISSLQLYIHRCLMNLEQSIGNPITSPNYIHVTPDSIPKYEWEWRKNYRVWEANRKVFLYPENYIDPALRDSKTSLFKELEDDLLQQNITIKSAEAAYKKYLAEFLELSHLRYAGAYYNLVDNGSVGDLNLTVEGADGLTRVESFTLNNPLHSKDSFVDTDKTYYYFFARTHLQPYQYYYRTYHPYKNLWGEWQKIEVPIEAEEISSIIQNGKLHIYWTDVQSKEVTKISNGNATSGSTIFKVAVKYTHLDANNKWAAPQRLFLGSTSKTDTEIVNRIKETFDQEKREVTIDKYKEEVFRKPYVSRTIKTNTLAIRHILTTEIPASEVNYATRKVDKMIAGHRIQIVPCVFNVKNGVFGQTYFFPQNGIDCTITIRDSFSAVVQCKSGSFDFAFNVPVQPDPASMQNVTLSGYLQDIYKYKADHTRDFMHQDWLIVNSEFGPEYLATFNSDNDYKHFVENGTQEFVKTKRIVKQFKNGEAHLEAIKGNILEVTPLSTIFSDELNIRLEEKGIDEFLSLSTQNMTDSSGQKFDFSGPYGPYYWEMFFHIPFLIANHLNANQDFKGAKYWYEKIFDPTASETPANGDHYWRFREFRDLDIQKLKDILSDEAVIAVYKQDPFDPHAIARLRISAYQKAIVMKYIDNLLDWGDFLFAQDTQESIIEAEMLYQLAKDILGKRPDKVGKCETEEDKLTCEKIEENSSNGSEFLINLENLYISLKIISREEKSALTASKYLAKLEKELANNNSTGNGSGARLSDFAILANARLISDLNPLLPNPQPIASTSLVRRVSNYSSVRDTINVSAFPDTNFIDTDEPGVEKVYGYSNSIPSTDIVAHSKLAFCIPVNEDLLNYWDRVEDRLFKIRNCMNISGVRRKLALFQPPIDPMLLVRARAAGLAIEDIIAEINNGSKILPNYRFTYMLEKAKQFTQNVQSFGSALLSALEKKDVEELTLLRSVHERNILKLTKDIKQKQIQEAQKQYNAITETLINIQNRIDYYQGLIEEGLTGWEITQQVSRHTATGFKIAEGGLHLFTGIYYLLPNTGSPYAITYGGQQLGASGAEFAAWTSAMASVADAISSSAGFEAGFQRRKEEWNFQLKTAEQDLIQTTQQSIAAEIRLNIAERDLEIHEKTIEQTNEVDEFYKSKFSGLRLYSYMASSLNRLYRLSYNMALELARQAESCYQWELEETVFVENDNWQSDYAGLLAGERLMFHLNRMEEAYLNKYTRIPEITQNFSLALLDPNELIKLKQTGKCDIKIPEIAFELLYPGQFRRLIRGVRISIPCIAGPYTNISAKLKLTASKYKKGNGTFHENPVVVNKSIITSSAANDSGTFEFNFRDERYLPFEYEGAISDWELILPSKIRSFNYNTISDVILHLSYTAKEGDRDAAEEELVNSLTQSSLLRLISLKYEFPNEFHHLLNADAPEIELDITKDHFPYFLNEMNPTIEELKIYFKPKPNQSISFPASLRMQNTPVTAIPGNDIPSGGTEINKIKCGVASLSGDIIRKWKLSSNQLDKNKIDDILILIKYKI